MQTSGTYADPVATAGFSGRRGDAILKLIWSFNFTVERRVFQQTRLPVLRVDTLLALIT